jgi:hypothetical protein
MHSSPLLSIGIWSLVATLLFQATAIATTFIQDDRVERSALVDVRSGNIFLDLS